MTQVDILWDEWRLNFAPEETFGEMAKRGTCVETRGVNNEPTVVISDELEERGKLAEVLRNAGFSSCYVNAVWPRDILVQHGDKVILGKTHCIGAVGGRYVFDDFESKVMLASVGDEPIRFPNYRNDLEGFFGIPFVPIIPARTRTHIDSDVLILPGIMIVDKDSFERKKGGLDNATTYREVAKEHGYELIVDDLAMEMHLKPLNCLVLNKDGEPFVVANSLTPHFLGILKNLGVDYETITANKSWRSNGSIRCRTNYVVDRTLFDWMGYQTTLTGV